jgi:hypothetical protein
MAPPHTPVSPAPMPPLPPPPAVLPPALLELVDSLRRRLLDVETYQVPELAACHASLTLHEQLASGVRNELGSARRDIEVSRSATVLSTMRLTGLSRSQELKLQCDELERARDRQGGMELVVDLQRHVNGWVGAARRGVSRLMVGCRALGLLSRIGMRYSRRGGVSIVCRPCRRGRNCWHHPPSRDLMVNSERMSLPSGQSQWVL